MEKADLVLVNPGSRAQVYGKLGTSLSGIEPPLWCGLIAAFIRKHGYSVTIIDAEAENWSPEYTAEKIAEYNPLLADVVVLGSNPSASSTPKMTAAGEVATALKKKAPHVKTTRRARGRLPVLYICILKCEKIESPGIVDRGQGEDEAPALDRHSQLTVVLEAM